MLLLLARHGETDYNKRLAIQGQLDIPLNERGQEQAQRLADMCAAFSITELHSSDLGRAKETAKAVASRHQCLPIQISASLRERHYGSLQGHPYPDDEVMPDDMEPLEALDKRFEAWLASVLAGHDSISTGSASPGSVNPDPDRQVIMVACHDGILRSLRRSALAKQPHPTLGQIGIAPGVELVELVVNTSLVILRVWRRGGKEGNRELAARIEAWGWRDSP